jgi:hypothetical protein
LIADLLRSMVVRGRCAAVDGRTPLLGRIAGTLEGAADRWIMYVG